MLNITPLRDQVPGIVFTFRALPRDDQGNILDEDAVSIDLTVPPLNFTSLEVMAPKLSDLKKPLVELQSIICDGLAAALRRNYRGVPRWLISDSMDAQNFQEYLSALMAISKLVAKVNAEGNAQAEPTPQPPSAT
jgi:hypothetical protein